MPIKKSMHQDITLRLVANAGILIEYDGTGIMVDGIHHDTTSRFSPVSTKDLQHMRQATHGFEQLDYLFFTHAHPDHFSALYLTELIHARKIKKIYLPKLAENTADSVLLFNHLKNKRVEVVTPSLAPGEFYSFELAPNIRGIALGAHHMGPQYKSVAHTCFLLELGGVRLLFTGDGDFVVDSYAAALADIELDVVFVNPLFYQHPQGQKVIKSLFTPKHLVVYHLPFPTDDTMGLGVMVERAKQRFQSTSWHTHIFQHEQQSLLIHP